MMTAMFSRLRRLGGFTSLFLTLLVGCGTSDDSAKTSHFEHDHEIAEHWPDDLADAAVKLRERLMELSSETPPDASDDHDEEQDHHEDHPHDPAAEIIDIVSWVPEIAADTDLPEQDWIPLADASESLTAQLRASDSELTDATRQKIASFCELIDQSVKKIPHHRFQDQTSP